MQEHLAAPAYCLPTLRNGIMNFKATIGGIRLESQDFDAIMRGITKGLTGNPKEDFAYLKQKMEEYKDHPMGKEILRACGRLMYQTIPDDLREKFDDAVQKDSLGSNAALEEAQFQTMKGNLEMAEKILESAIHRWEKLYETGAFQDDRVSEYRDFENPMEYYLYCARKESEKDVRRIPEPVSSLYLAYGYTLFDMDRLDEAEEALKTAHHWDPASTQILYELAEVYKKRGQLKPFWELTLEALSLAFTRAQVSRGYRNLGYYFIEKKAWKDAIVFFYLALSFCAEKDEHGRMMIQNELLFIHMQTHQDINPPTDEDVHACFEKHGIPIGVDESVLRLAYTLGQQAKEAGVKEDAIFFFKIVYGIVQIDEIRDELEALGVTVAEH